MMPDIFSHDSSEDRFLVNTRFLLQNIHISVFNIIIRQSDIDNPYISAGILSELHNLIAKSSAAYIFLHRNNQMMILKYLQQHLFIHRLYKTGIDQRTVIA